MENTYKSSSNEKLKLDNNKFLLNCSPKKTKNHLIPNTKINYIIHGNSPNNTNFINSSNQNTNTSTNNKLNYYLDTIQSIKDIEPNLNLNKSIVYEYYKAASIFYVESKFFFNFSRKFPGIHSYPSQYNK